MGLLDHVVARTLPVVPRSIVQRVSARYIAGPELDDARRVVAELNAVGKRATIDVLGEEIRHPDEARAIAEAYRAVLTAIEDDHLDANVSVKLTALGLELDLSLCRELIEVVVRHAAERGTFVRIDMEDSSCTDATLALYRVLRAAGHDNVGIVLQAALKRTLADVAALSDLRPRVRLCKGIYVERPELAFQEPAVVRRHFVSCLDALLEAGCHVAVATHDEELIVAALDRVRGLGGDGYELQMLLGVREARATELARAGHPLRIYVPYGRRWYEYSLRRLKENPAMATTIATATAGRLLGRDT
ncbi:MAG: proline dehydrogenase family protein [Gaiella sp.]